MFVLLNIATIQRRTANEGPALSHKGSLAQFTL